MLHTVRFCVQKGVVYLLDLFIAKSVGTLFIDIADIFCFGKGLPISM